MRDIAIRVIAGAATGAVIVASLVGLYGTRLTEPADVPRLAWTPNREPGDIGWRARHESQVGHNGMGSEMACHRGRPHLEPQDSGLVGLERDENLLHELMHEQEFLPNCDSIMALWTTIPFYRLQLEAVATCFGLQVYTVDSVYRFRKGLAVTRISLANGGALGFEDIYAALDHWCIAGSGANP